MHVHDGDGEEGMGRRMVVFVGNIDVVCQHPSFLVPMSGFCSPKCILPEITSINRILFLCPKQITFESGYTSAPQSCTDVETLHSHAVMWRHSTVMQ